MLYTGCIDQSKILAPHASTPGYRRIITIRSLGETVQYDTANGLAIDFVRESGEWQMERKSNGNIWKGTGGRKSVRRATGVRRYTGTLWGTCTIPPKIHNDVRDVVVRVSVGEKKV